MSNETKQTVRIGSVREWVRFGAKETCHIEKISPLLEEWAQYTIEETRTVGRQAFVCSMLDNGKKHRAANYFSTSAFVKCTPEELKELEQKIIAIDNRISLKKLQGNFEVAEMERYKDSTVQNLLWVISTPNKTKITISDNDKNRGFYLDEKDGKRPVLFRKGRNRHVVPVLFHPDNDDKLVLKGYREKIQGKGKEDYLYLILPCNYCAIIILPKKDPRLVALDKEAKYAYSEKEEWMVLRGIGRKHMEVVKGYLEKWITKTDAADAQGTITEVFEATYTTTTLSKSTGQRVKKTVAVMPGMLLLKCSEKTLFETIQADICDKDTHSWKDIGLTDNYLAKHVFLNKDKRPVHTTDKAVGAFKQALEDFDKLTQMNPKDKLKAGWVRVCNETSPFYMLVGKLSECKRKKDKEAGLCNFVIAACYELMTDKFSAKMKLTDLEVYTDAEYDAIEKQLKKAKRRKR